MGQPVQRDHDLDELLDRATSTIEGLTERLRQLSKRASDAEGDAARSREALDSFTAVLDELVEIGRDVAAGREVVMLRLHALRAATDPGIAADTREAEERFALDKGLDDAVDFADFERRWRAWEREQATR